MAVMSSPSPRPDGAQARSAPGQITAILTLFCDGPTLGVGRSFAILDESLLVG